MVERASNKVFISYRREVSTYMATALYQQLTERDIDVFYDRKMPAGEWPQTLLNQINARPYMIPILAPGTLNDCRRSEDWVFRELLEATRTKRILLPVYTPDFDFEDIGSYLPDDIAHALRSSQMLEIPPDYHEDAMKRVADLLVPVPDATEPSAGAVEAAEAQRTVLKAVDPVTRTQLKSERYVALAYEKAMNSDHPGAIADLNQAIRLNDSNARAYTNRGNSYYEQERFKAALADYDTAIDLAPRDATAYSNRGSVHYQLEDYEAAEADYDEAIRIGTSNDAFAYSNRGNARMRRGNLGGAIADYDKAISIDRSWVAAYNNKAEALNKMGHYDEALRQIDEALRLDPDDVDLQTTRGEILENLGRSDGA